MSEFPIDDYDVVLAGISHWPEKYRALTVDALNRAKPREVFLQNDSFGWFLDDCLLTNRRHEGLARLRWIVRHEPLPDIPIRHLKASVKRAVVLIEAVAPLVAEHLHRHLSWKPSPHYTGNWIWSA